jgi:hypothetical protein
VLGKERVFAFLDFRSLNISTKNKNDALVSKKNKNSHLAHSETPHRCRVQISSMKNESLVIMPASHCCCLLCANFVPEKQESGHHACWALLLPPSMRCSYFVSK